MVFPVFASKLESSMQKNADNWTQNETTSRGGSITSGDIGQIKEDPSVPVGDTAWVIILGIGLSYGAYSLTKKRQEA